MQKFRRKLTFFKSMKLILLFSQRSFAQVVHDLLGTGSLRFNCLLSFNSCRTNRKTHVRRFFNALHLTQIPRTTLREPKVEGKTRKKPRDYETTTIHKKKRKTKNQNQTAARK
uniref:Putative secreted protein n=1 Tax=Anopheles darlingi TaxID=43151 RepID=A0A2M4D9I7_ANODA